MISASLKSILWDDDVKTAFSLFEQDIYHQLQDKVIYDTGRPTLNKLGYDIPLIREQQKSNSSPERKMQSGKDIPARPRHDSDRMSVESGEEAPRSATIAKGDNSKSSMRLNVEKLMSDLRPIDMSP